MAKTRGQRTFPWRILKIATEDAQLLDTDLVYSLVKALYENNGYLMKIHPSAAYTTPENAVKYCPIPLHPGTIKYLKEKGIAVPAQLMP